MVGDPGRVGEDVVRVTLAAVETVLRALPPQPAVLTVLAAGAEAELYLTFERAPAGACAVAGLGDAVAGLGDAVAGLGDAVAGLGDAVPAAAAWRASLEAEDTGPGCLEVRWRIPVPE
jgi:hypothetical protein